MAHADHHDAHHGAENLHHHAPADPKKVLPGVILVLALFWGLSYAGHYLFIKSPAHSSAGAAHGAPDAGHH